MVDTDQSARIKKARIHIFLGSANAILKAYAPEYAVRFNDDEDKYELLDRLGRILFRRRSSEPMLSVITHFIIKVEP